MNPNRISTRRAAVAAAVDTTTPGKKCSSGTTRCLKNKTEEAVQAAWNKEAIALNNEKLTPQYIRSEVEYFRQEVSSQLNNLLYRIGNFEEKGRVDFIRQRLDNIEHEFFSFANCKPVCEMLENHKSSWIPNSKDGEPNCRRK